ncbi:WAS/WASL-interacting protein family member 3-like [Bacillus rossius redtenbacheri]|uniref:WAS/WASL-interacting protein family member 3-like n=1 Tax=Bacillus rossius redtenbacheri TaxID=93214 RepID=UPI002FDD6E6D
MPLQPTPPPQTPPPADQWIAGAMPGSIVIKTTHFKTADATPLHVAAEMPPHMPPLTSPPPPPPAENASGAVPRLTWATSPHFPDSQQAAEAVPYYAMNITPPPTLLHPTTERATGAAARLKTATSRPSPADHQVADTMPLPPRTPLWACNLCTSHAPLKALRNRPPLRVRHCRPPHLLLKAPRLLRPPRVPPWACRRLPLKSLRRGHHRPPRPPPWQSGTVHTDTTTSPDTPACFVGSWERGETQALGRARRRRGVVVSWMRETVVTEAGRSALVESQS